MLKKWTNIAFFAFVALAFISAVLGAVGYVVPGLTKIVILFIMASLILKCILDWREGRDKSLCIIVIVCAGLAAIVNAILLVEELFFAG